jgi:hypothetical protein
MATRIARPAVRRILATWTVLLMGLAGSRAVEAVPIISVGSATVDVGDLVTILVFIDDATDLTFWQFDLAFDPAVVQANSITEGPFLSAFGATLFGAGAIDNGAGLISLVTNAYLDLPPNPAGDGVLAEVQFLAPASGTSLLVLANVFLNLSTEGFEIENGQITVTGDSNHQRDAEARS